MDLLKGRFTAFSDDFWRSGIRRTASNSNLSVTDSNAISHQVQHDGIAVRQSISRLRQYLN
jgi:hypothetical protein